MTDHTYQFSPMTSDDLPMVRRWLETPDVIAWWGDAAEQYALVSGDMDEPAMAQFIVATDRQRFAYLQSFDLTAWPEDGFGPQPAGTRAIDQFIGEPGMLDRGHGSAFIRAFIADLFTMGTPRVITDPDPANARAIRAYEKAGFRKGGVVTTQGGPALLMVCNND
ncbi:GNAT family N-acetyltransferase [Bradyrhizobium prioriisuperbiae]|uniref:GNAT family N-acetyltransferase n=1 Tax=Bradyrhizobium prioriisuperbiae TaxID=2854389 RepID=UPI0028ED275E|nr:GNAT family N-acetyltransferase [Bradyrhizobium prioritasuperba]